MEAFILVRWLDGYGYMDGWIGEWMGGYMDGWMDGRVGGCVGGHGGLEEELLAGLQVVYGQQALQAVPGEARQARGPLNQLTATAVRGVGGWVGGWVGG